MGFYENRILPGLIDCACSSPPLMAMREKIVPQAQGEVLEVGIGSGINLSLYRAEQVQKVWGLEPSEGMRRKAQANVAAADVELEWLGLPGEQIPLPDASVDTVLLTFTLCTIPDWQAALAQMRRVLKPEGVLLFCEHGLSPEEAVARWQHRLNPLWKRLAGGCHLNRPIADYLCAAGFQLDELHTEYAKKTPKFAGFISHGRASLAKA